MSPSRRLLLLIFLPKETQENIKCIFLGIIFAYKSIHIDQFCRIRIIDEKAAFLKRLKTRHACTRVKKDGIMCVAEAACELKRSWAGERILIVWFTATLFMSACLLFLVQPMVGKMILPLYGGTPAVWNGCMVFFQALLLAGYAYSHLSIRWLGPKLQARIHIILMLIPFTLLPVMVSAKDAPPPDSNPLLWLLGTLFFAVGLPYFVVASSAPLLQRWFNATGHTSSGDPYFLYAASNAGSLLALLSYPLVYEPLMDLSGQSLVWAIGYGILAVMVLGCALLLWQTQKVLGRGQAGSPAVSPDEPGTFDSTFENSPSWRKRVFWIFCSFIPSSLMLSVTAFITTDIASMPLLWILPLSIYLLTFIFVFARREIIPHALVVRVLPYLFISCAPLVFLTLPKYELLLVPLHLLIFFCAAMLCHGELAKSRPAAKHLTEFYIWMSLGGVLGGLFNAIVAPIIFASVLEYPLGIALACLILPAIGNEGNQQGSRWTDVLFPVLLVCLGLVILKVLELTAIENPVISFAILFALTALICFGFKERPLRFGLGYGVLLFLIMSFVQAAAGTHLYSSRNFFGIKRVIINKDGDAHVLYHGRIIHGSQYVDLSRRAEALTYFHAKGPVGDVFAVYNESALTPTAAIIGLGAGTVASYATSRHHFVFYEIDPEVKEIASNPRFFSFLSDMKGSSEIILGDGRLTLAKAPDHKYGLILVDAFSSDAIPIHLITREALQLYLSKLESNGVVVFHISNRFFNLAPLLGKLASELGLVCLEKKDLDVGEEEMRQGKTPSHYVVVGRIGSVIERFSARGKWSSVTVRLDGPAWTDRYSNLLSVIKWK